jgi:hypothetical protein
MQSRRPIRQAQVLHRSGLGRVDLAAGRPDLAATGVGEGGPGGGDAESDGDRGWGGRIRWQGG